MIARLLVVDDIPAFRQYVREKIRDHPGFSVVGEAPDGLTAIEQADALRPDIILLDIAMPWLNGIESARRIRGLIPEQKIIFFTENRSAEMLREALLLGAKGYVIKSDAGTELVSALEAVQLGKVYVSKSFGHSSTQPN